MIQLNYRDSKPIYEQVKDGIRRLIVTGAVASGEKLPSVKELASGLAINPNTISKAYRELEAEGYIDIVSGKGAFIAAGGQVEDYRRMELLEEFDELVEELFFLSVPPETLKERVVAIEGRGKNE